MWGQFCTLTSLPLSIIIQSYDGGQLDLVKQTASTFVPNKFNHIKPYLVHLETGGFALGLGLGL